MRRRRVTVLDLAARVSARSLYARVMNPNLASVMPQAIAAWCEELGHETTYVCYTGFEDLDALVGIETDAVFIAAFTRSAQTAYAVANLFRQRGAVTILGGPHARSYPEDALRFFDYVLGFTDRDTVDEVLKELRPGTVHGRWLSAPRQPANLPPVAARWKFIAETMAKAPVLRIIPMIASMGCPYTCNFCVDATVDYQPLSYDQLRDDLRFLLTRMPKPMVGWHDPNFGVRFDDYMTAIEDVVPPGRMLFIAESSLSLLSEANLRRLRANGFIGMMPGIESWYEHGAKSKTGRCTGIEKVRQVSDHVNMVVRHIPFVQTNFVLGLDSDRGSEPFDLTKRFFDLTPGAFPAFNMFTAYGRGAPVNLDLQRAGRVLPFPFFFLDGNHAMNVRPLHYEWGEFYRRSAETTRYALSGPRAWRRFAANRGAVRLSNLARGHFSLKRVDFHQRVLGLLDSDPEMRPYFEGETTQLPGFYRARMRGALGRLWKALPPGAVDHDPNAFRADPLAYTVARGRARATAPRVSAAR